MTPIGPGIPDLSIRAFDPASDYGPVAAFLRESNRADGTDWLPSEVVLRDEWQPTPRFEPARDAFVATASSRIVGVADTAWRVRGGARVAHEVHPVVEPATRRLGLGGELLRRVEARAAEVAAAATDDRAHVLDAFMEVHVPGVAEFAAAAGYAPRTHGFRMRRLLAEPIPDGPLPAGLEVRPVRPEHHRAIWDADTEAFLDHDEPAERDESDFVTWFAQPAIDTSLWRVAWAGDEVAGSVMTIIWPEENEALGVQRAWLEHVSVRRPWRRRGVASALIAETLLMLRARGFDEAMLGVHGQNPTGAAGVYERAGFRIHRRWSVWRKSMALPGGPLT